MLKLKHIKFNGVRKRLMQCGENTNSMHNVERYKPGEIFEPHATELSEVPSVGVAGKNYIWAIHAKNSKFLYTWKKWNIKLEWTLDFWCLNIFKCTPSSTFTCTGRCIYSRPYGQLKKVGINTLWWKGIYKNQWCWITINTLWWKGIFKNQCCWTTIATLWWKGIYNNQW